MITPTDKNILVKLDTVQKTTGGLFLPESQTDSKKYVHVVALGPNVEFKLQVGDLVVVRPGSPGVEVEDRNQKFLLVHESCIVAVRS
jgi:co-chaperonin GroES (HSP10)